MDFGDALKVLKRGGMVCRAGWNGKGMWLLLVRADSWACGISAPTGSLHHPRNLPWIGMRTADNGFVPWLASQTDVLADDWQVVS